MPKKTGNKFLSGEARSSGFEAGEGFTYSKEPRMIKKVLMLASLVLLFQTQAQDQIAHTDMTPEQYQQFALNLLDEIIQAIRQENPQAERLSEGDIAIAFAAYCDWTAAARYQDQETTLKDKTDAPRDFGITENKLAGILIDFNGYCNAHCGCGYCPGDVFPTREEQAQWIKDHYVLV